MRSESGNLTTALVEVAEGVWTGYHPMRLLGLPLGRRVTAVRAESGRWVVFSPLRYTREVDADLRRLGPIAAIIVPNRVHDLFYNRYFEPFGDVPFVATETVQRQHPKWPLQSLSERLQSEGGLEWRLIEGMPWVDETVFLHRSSRTLILTDLLFYIPRVHGLLTHWWLSLAGIGTKPGPSRLERALIWNRQAFRASLLEVLAWDFDRLVGGHGEIIATGARQVLREAFAEYI